MQPKFKQGDKVRNKDYGDYGTIISIEGNAAIIDYGYDDGYFTTDFDDLELVERPAPIDPTTAFLTELQNLLRKYNAEIYGDYIDECVGIVIGNKDIRYSNMSLTPDNIFDYEKSN